MNAEQRLLDNALKAFEKETKVPAKIKVIPVGQTTDWDACVVLGDKPTYTFNAETKRWAQNRNLGALIYQLQKIPQALLVADYINPNLATRLREEGIQFIDCAGNANIQREGITIWVKGNPKPRDPLADIDGLPNFQTNRLKELARLQGAGALRVIYQVLINRDVLNAPYREVAEKAGVALGTFGWVMNALVNTEYVRRTGKGKGAVKNLANPKGLFDLFVEHYPKVLKPKLELGWFHLTGGQWYKKIDITKFEGVWGGEYAAEKQTGYLKPYEGTVYLHNPDRLAELAVAGRFRKGAWTDGPEGKVLVLQAFWEKGDPNRKVTHPLLTYADLMATADPRNMEAAEMLKQKELAYEFTN